MSDSYSSSKYNRTLTDEELEILKDSFRILRENYSEHMKQVSETMTIFNNQIKESIQRSLGPLQESISQQQFALRECMQKSIIPFLENTKQFQSELSKSLASNNQLDLELPKLYIEKIEPIYISIANEFQGNEFINDTKIYPDDIQDSIKTKVLTWEQFITIITFLITLISFIQSQIPDKQIERHTEALYQLIEIQMQLLEPQNVDGLLSE